MTLGRLSGSENDTAVGSGKSSPVSTEVDMVKSAGRSNPFKGATVDSKCSSAVNVVFGISKWESVKACPSPPLELLNAGASIPRAPYWNVSVGADPEFKASRPVSVGKEFNPARLLS